MKELITREIAQEVISECLAEGFETNDIRDYLEESYILVSEAEFSGQTTKTGKMASAIAGGSVAGGGFKEKLGGSILGLIAYLGYKKHARIQFVKDVEQNFGEKDAEKLKMALSTYNQNKKDSEALNTIKSYQVKLNAKIGKI